MGKAVRKSLIGRFDSTKSEAIMITEEIKNSHVIFNPIQHLLRIIKIFICKSLIWRCGV